MSEQVVGRIDEMGQRIDELEKSIADLASQTGTTEEVGMRSESLWCYGGRGAEWMLHRVFGVVGDSQSGSVLFVLFCFWWVRLAKHTRIAGLVMKR